MKLDFALTADYAYVGDGGKLFILGQFQYLFAAQLPAVHPRMCVAFRVTAQKAEVREGTAPMRIEITDGDGALIFPPQSPMRLAFAPIGPASPALMQAMAVLEFDMMPLPKFGDYSVNIFVNEILLGQASFNVQPMPKQPPA